MEKMAKDKTVKATKKQLSLDVLKKEVKEIDERMVSLDKKLDDMNIGIVATCATIETVQRQIKELYDGYNKIIAYLDENKMSSMEKEARTKERIGISEEKIAERIRHLYLSISVIFITFLLLALATRLPPP